MIPGFSDLTLLVLLGGLYLCTCELVDRVLDAIRYRRR